MMNRMVTRRHFVFRHATTVHPFVWRGLLPTLGLLALLWFGLAPFARGWIEASVAREVRASLDDRDLRWVDVAISGQHVTLSGRPPNTGAGEAALDVARATTCPTWAGRWTCPVTVDGEFGAVAALAAPSVPAPPPASKPSPATAQQAPPPATAPPSPQVQAQARACERALAEQLSKAQILFDSGTARLDRSNRALLDRLAAAVKTCPGVVRVQGHTDSKGSAGSNQKLSDARAAAVRDALLARGVNPRQIVAEGYGETRPLARNSTEAGRAANRRIEFHAD